MFQDDDGKGEAIGSMVRISDATRTAVEAVWFDLRHEIIQGNLYPPGSRLGIEHLKSVYGVSGSTIREALTRLISDHLVSVEEQKGFRVTALSVDDLRDLTDARIIIECAALRESVSKADEEWEANLVSTFHRLTRADERLREDPEASFDIWELRNKEFHVALVSGAKSPWIQRFHLTILQQSERYRRVTSRMPMSRESVHQEHEAIFEAAMARDSGRAETALRSHIQRAMDILEGAGASSCAMKTLRLPGDTDAQLAKIPFSPARQGSMHRDRGN